MKVRELMSTPVVSVTPDTGVGEVARLMVRYGLSGLPVLGPAGELVGLVTKRDVVAKHAHPHVPFYLGILGGVVPIDLPGREAEVERVFAVTSGELMQKHPRIVAPDDDIEHVADLMVNEDANPVPVIERGQVVGIISQSDILRLVAREESESSEPAT